MAKQFERKPVGRREAKIIKRMRAVGRLPVSKVAEVVRCNKTSAYAVLSGGARFAKRGAKSKLTPKILTHLFKENSVPPYALKAHPDQGRREGPLCFFKGVPEPVQEVVAQDRPAPP